jgi:hypothetical protein
MSSSRAHADGRPTLLVAALLAVVALVAFAVAAIGDNPAQGATSTPDKVLYVQTTGSNGTYLQYVPGDGSKATKQSVTSGGGCATPSPSGPPILGMSARVYPSGYSDAPSAAVVGAYKSRTGVCAIGQAWQIEPNEGLVFSVGTNSLVAGRTYAQATIVLARQDKSTASSPPVVVQLVTRLNGAVVATKTVNVPGPNDTAVLADTGLSRTGFDAVEIQVLSPSTAGVSVVGPTSTFTFANQLCVSDAIQTTSTDGTVATGDVKATVTYVANATAPVCKSYTTFSAQVNDGTGTRVVDFGTQNTPGARLTMSIDWGLVDKCRPDAAGPEPTCPTSTIDFGSGEVPQTYCTTANPPTTPPWCTTDRTFEYVTVGGVEKTHVTETWSGFGDPTARFR